MPSSLTISSLNIRLQQLQPFPISSCHKIVSFSFRSYISIISIIHRTTTNSTAYTAQQWQQTLSNEMSQEIKIAQK